MYTVIGTKLSRTYRVVWALEEIGLEYRIDPSPPRSARVRALNPSGKVPVLLTDEGPISDSVAILTYLAETTEKMTYPAGSYARARQDALTQFIVSELDAALWTVAKHSFVLPEAERVPEIRTTARHEFARALETLDAELGNRPFLAGDMFTIPDLLLGHCGSWGASARMAPPKGRMKTFLAELRNRPAALRAWAAFDAPG